MRSATIALLAGIAASNGALAQAGTPELQLRDALLKHFAQDNLIPIFLARPHAVGDVLQATGAKFAASRDCFPKLPAGTPAKTDSVKTLVINTSAEGNFGIGMRRIYEVFAKAGIVSKSRMTLTFLDQEYVGATTTDLMKAYNPTRCPQIQPLVQGHSTEGAKLPEPILIVLQEVYYARKKLVVELDKSADVEAAAKDAADSAASLGLTAELKAGADQSKQLMVESSQVLPVAARIAFIPRPITGVTLGGSGNADVKGFLWRAAPNQPGPADKAGFAVLGQAIEAATRGGTNPLLTE